MKEINYFEVLSVDEFALLINMNKEQVINTIKWIHNNDEGPIKTNLIIPEKMRLVDWINATCICHLLENDFCDVHLALNKLGMISIDEFASRVKMSKEQVLNQILDDDQYGGTNKFVPHGATLDHWISLACNCDLLYGYICPVHQKLKKEKDPAYTLKPNSYY
ncbi:MAG: hypothetical protein GX864_00375 [Mollicutes bacterium]|nr:hypothetical protein [Mollicutes bacterium]